MKNRLIYLLIVLAFPSAVLAEGNSCVRRDYLLYRLPKDYHSDDIKVFHLVHSLLFPELKLQISTSPPTTRDYADFYDTAVSNDCDYDESYQYVYLSTGNKRAALFHDYICMVQLAVTYALHHRALAENLSKDDTTLMLTHLLPVVLELYKTNLATDRERYAVKSESYLRKLATLPVKNKGQVASVVMYTSMGSEYLGLYSFIHSSGKYVVYNVFDLGFSREKTLRNWRDKRNRIVVYPTSNHIQTFYDEIIDYFEPEVVIGK